MNTAFKSGDKVVRVGHEGPVGIVQKVRLETMRAGLKDPDEQSRSVTISVLWGNGTLSHFVPDGLEKR